MKKYFIGLFGAHNEIQDKLTEYLRQTEDMVLAMERAIGAYLKQERENFANLFGRINEAEIS